MPQLPFLIVMLVFFFFPFQKLNHELLLLNSFNNLVQPSELLIYHL